MNEVRDIYNEGVDDFAKALKRLLKEKQERGETLTARDIDKVRKEIKYL